MMKKPGWWRKRKEKKKNTDTHTHTLIDRRIVCKIDSHDGEKNEFRIFRRFISEIFVYVSIDRILSLKDYFGSQLMKWDEWMFQTRSTFFFLSIKSIKKKGESEVILTYYLSLFFSFLSFETCIPTSNESHLYSEM
jgi:hypothetical protein